MKNEFVHPPIRRGVLILPADGFAQNVDFNLASLPGQVFGGNQNVSICIKSMKKSYGY